MIFKKLILNIVDNKMDSSKKEIKEKKQRKQRPKMSEEERKRRKNECEKKRYRRIVQATGKVVKERARTAEETKAWRTERVACECGCIIARGNLPVHRRSKKHQQLMFEISSRAES